MNFELLGQTCRLVGLRSVDCCYGFRANCSRDLRETATCDFDANDSPPCVTSQGNRVPTLAYRPDSGSTYRQETGVDTESGVLGHLFALIPGESPPQMLGKPLSRDS